MPEDHKSQEGNPTTIAESWLNSFQTRCDQVSSNPGSQQHLENVLDLFLLNGWWRDKLCITWDFRTREGVEQIRTFLSENEALAKTGFNDCYIDSSTGLGGPTLTKEPGSTGELLDIIQFMFRFKTTKPAGAGRGIVKLSPSKGDPHIEWKAFVLFTGLESLDGHSENDTRPLGHYENHTRSWDSIHHQEVANAVEHPEVLIVGGAQTGLITAARLHKLGIRVLLIEKTPRIGDVWRNRYEMLTLHTTIALTQMPYQPYPQSMPEFMPRSKFADYLEFFSIFQDIPYLTSAEMLPNPTYDPETKSWTVRVRHAGKEINLLPHHLIMATGALGEPKMPLVEGMDTFKGKLFHSDDHKNANGWKGKKVVIVGAGVTGTDIALEADVVGAKVLIVQRSPVTVVRLSNVKPGLDRIYPPNRPTEDSDWFREATPYNLFFRLCNNVLVPIAEQEERELHEGLRARGFLIGWGEEMGRGRIGHLGLVSTKLGGFCVDVGCAQRIVDGSIKIKSNVEIAKLDSDKVFFTDGSQAEADIVIFATGYLSMSHTMTHLLGPNVLKSKPKIWDLDEEGEYYGVYRQTDIPRLWYAAGGFSEARGFSKFLALRILAEKLGVLEK